MSSREELHRLIDQLDDAAVPGATEVLAQMMTQRIAYHDGLAAPRRRLSFVGSFSSGEGDIAARSGQILRDGLGQPEY